MAAIAGPPSPYVVELRPGVMTSTGLEHQPSIKPSCGLRGTNSSFAYPAVRLASAIDAFGASGVFHSACTGDFAAMLSSIARDMARVFTEGICLDDAASTDQGTPLAG